MLRRPNSHSERRPGSAVWRGISIVGILLTWATGAIAAPQPAEERSPPLARGHATAAVATPLPSASAPTAAAPTAERRQVAVIDLVADDEAGALARKATALLVRHRELAPLADPTLAAMLIGPMQDEHAGPVEAAQRALTDANDALARFELSVAAARATAGQEELNSVAPEPEVLALYAELAFVLGQAKLADGDAPAARASFLLTQRLTPHRQLDPARYLPDVIAAYRDAARGADRRVPIQIRGQGDAYVDGKPVGAAPLTVELESGSHVIHLFGATRLARGARINATASAPSVVVLPDARASQAVLVARARRAAMQALDPMELTRSVASLAQLVGVGDVIVLRYHEQALSAQAWRDRSPGAGRIRLAREGDAISAALLDLAPLDARIVTAPPEFVVPPPPKAWYRRRWVQVSIVTGALAVVTAAIVISTNRDGGSVGIEPGTSF
ncbi:MAG: hypothetical protein R3B48_09575 [Kofleriaceae bacterium]